MKDIAYRIFEKASSNWLVMFLLLFIPGQLVIYLGVVMMNFQVTTDWVLEGEIMLAGAAALVASFTYSLHLLTKGMEGWPSWKKISVVFFYATGLFVLTDFILHEYFGNPSMILSIFSSSVVLMSVIILTLVGGISIFLAAKFLVRNKE